MRRLLRLHVALLGRAVELASTKAFLQRILVALHQLGESLGDLLSNDSLQPINLHVQVLKGLGFRLDLLLLATVRIFQARLFNHLADVVLADVPCFRAWVIYGIEHLVAQHHRIVQLHDHILARGASVCLAHTSQVLSMARQLLVLSLGA